MSLTYYVNEFNVARGNQDSEEMIFQIHLMVQADPFDQMDTIRNCMENVFSDFPDLQYVGTFPDLDLSSVESCEDNLGRELNWVEDRLCMTCLDRIRQIAVALEEYGVLKQIAYASNNNTIIETAQSKTDPRKSSSAAHHSAREQKNDVQWKIVGVGLTVVFGLLWWRC